jgi:hypothetical protein
MRGKQVSYLADKTVESFSLSRVAILDGATGAEAIDGRFYGARQATLKANMGDWDNTGDDAILSTWYWLNNAALSVEGGFVPFGLVSQLSGAPLTTSGAATKATLVFTPAGTGVNAFDYSGAAARDFTVNDGSGATDVTLDAAYTNLAGVVAAIDADLGAGYVVTASGSQVKIEAAAAGDKRIIVGGTSAPAVTASAGYLSTPGTGGDTEEIDLWPIDASNQPPKPVLLTMPARDRFGALRELQICLYRVQFAPIDFTGPQYKTGLGVNYSGRANFSPINEVGVELPKLCVGRLINKPALIG